MKLETILLILLSDLLGQWVYYDLSDWQVPEAATGENTFVTLRTLNQWWHQNVYEWTLEAPQCLVDHSAWWCHQMETFSASLSLCVGNSPVTGEFPPQRPVTRSFDVFFALHMNKQLSKQSIHWWFDMPSRSLWWDDVFRSGKCLFKVSDGLKANEF